MYSARITRLNPTAFIILIDQSSSMEEKITFNSELMTKAEVVALITNMIISELTHRCRRESGIANYFEIATLGYSDNNVYSLLETKKQFLNITELLALNCRKIKYNKERRLPNGRSVVVNSEQMCWISPQSQGNTPMCAALLKARDMAAKWCGSKAHRSSYPPTIFNITDGESSDGNEQELLSVADDIKSLATDDGNVLLININICGHKYANFQQIIFPSSKQELPADCRYANLLYDMSSQMPAEYNDTIVDIRPAAVAPFRGMGFNTSATEIISMMNIGSMSVNII